MRDTARSEQSANVGLGSYAFRFEPVVRQVSEFRRTIGGNIADLRRVGKGGSGLSLPILYDFVPLLSIFRDPLRPMVAPC